MTSPTQKGEREEALKAATRIVVAADNVSASDGDARKPAIRRLNAETENQYAVVRIARVLLSSSKAEGEMREALPTSYTIIARCRVREIVGRMRQYAPSLRGRGETASDAAYNRTLADADYLEELMKQLEIPL